MHYIMKSSLVEQEKKKFFEHVAESIMSFIKGVVSCLSAIRVTFQWNCPFGSKQLSAVQNQEVSLVGRFFCIK